MTSSTNPLAIYQWLKDNIDLESDADTKKQDLLNGLEFHFKLNREDSKQWLMNFFRNFKDYEQKVSGDTTDLIDYKELETSRRKPSGMICKSCKKEINSDESKQYCNDECRQQYINNIILFWKPDILIESSGENGKDLAILQQESRLAFMRLVKDAEPDELVLRIKVLRHVLMEAYQIGFDALHRDKLREKLDEELSVKGTAKRLAEERDKTRQENIELRRQIQEIEKSGEKVHKSVKQAVKAGATFVTGKCNICGKETLKETCSPEHRAQWDAVKGWMRMGFSEQKARDTVNQITEANKIKEMIDGATETENGAN